MLQDFVDTLATAAARLEESAYPNTVINSQITQNILG